MTSIVFCNFPVANIETNLHFINICHDYFVLFDTEITVAASDRFPISNSEMRDLQQTLCTEPPLLHQFV